MSGQVFEYDPPERFVVGTVGEPGARAFYLQARGTVAGQPGRRLTSVAIEKQQVSVLAERLDDMLDEVVRRSRGSASVPAVAPVGTEDMEPLENPVEEDFRVGTMSLGWDEDREVVIIECFATEERDFDPVQEEEELDPSQPPGTDGDRAVLRVRLTGSTARRFARRALAVVAAGRPPCPFCEQPLDPNGHLCPRANGHRR